MPDTPSLKDEAESLRASMQLVPPRAREYERGDD